MNQERLMKVIVAPVISEKATMVGEKRNQVVFEVLPDATKAEIKAAVELLFKDQVKGLLGGPVAYAIPVAGKFALHHFGLGFIGKPNVHQSYRFLLRSAAGTGDAGDAEAESRFAAFADPLCHGPIILKSGSVHSALLQRPI